MDGQRGDAGSVQAHRRTRGEDGDHGAIPVAETGCIHSRGGNRASHHKYHRCSCPRRDAHLVGEEGHKGRLGAA